MARQFSTKLAAAVLGTVSALALQMLRKQIALDVMPVHRLEHIQPITYRLCPRQAQARA